MVVLLNAGAIRQDRCLDFHFLFDYLTSGHLAVCN